MANGGRFKSQVREVINRNTVVSLALGQSFNVFLPVYDGGVDFIMYRETDAAMRKVQLKGRWTIDRKYENRDIWIAFPVVADWYLVPHDEMVANAGKALESDSWRIKGLYSSGSPSKATIRRIAPYRFGSIADVAAKAAKEEN